MAIKKFAKYKDQSKKNGANFIILIYILTSRQHNWTFNDRAKSTLRNVGNDL